MRTFRRILVALLLVAAVMVGAIIVAYQAGLYGGPEGEPGELVIVGGTLFSAAGVAPTENPGIVLRDGLIACMGTSCRPSSDAVEVDASGLAILPGLIDLHVHFLSRRDRPNLLEMIWSSAQMRPDLRRNLLESGITSVRSLGDPRDAIFEVERGIETRRLGGPRMFIAGPIFTAPGGHPTVRGQDPNPVEIGGPMAFQSNDPQEVRDEVAVLAEQGVDGIKVVLHGSEATESRTAMPTVSLETLDALVEAAEERGLWVAVHAGPLAETAEAARHGATTIEHGVRHGNLIDKPTLELLVENQVVYVPTLGREPQGHLNVPALYQAGVAIGVGTDNENYFEELERLRDAGMPDVEILLAATRNGARALRLDDTLGTIEEGKMADLILVDGEPWNDVSSLREARMVIQGGHVVLQRR